MENISKMKGHSSELRYVNAKLPDLFFVILSYTQLWCNFGTFYCDFAEMRFENRALKCIIDLMRTF